MEGNGVVGILSEECYLWERRVPLTPLHCARLLHGGDSGNGVKKVVVQPSTKRIYLDAQYEDVGCQISDDLSECGLILGVKQPKLEMILPNRSYAFFSHTHKAQKENMALLDKIMEEKASLCDYELIVDGDGKRLLAFGKFAGRAGFVDLLHTLGMRYLNLGYSTPFLSLGASYMYPSLAAAKAAVISIGEEIATSGVPSGIPPIVFVFTGSGKVSQGAQEMFKLLPHTFVEPCKLPELHQTDGNLNHHVSPKRVFEVYGCVATCKDMVIPKDSSRKFDKVEYYAHPEHYVPIFHKNIAPYASAIVNCMYWEKRYPRLLTNMQMQELTKQGCPLVAISDITCDVGGSIEFINQTTTLEKPFFRFDPVNGSYYTDMAGDGVICLAVDILPTEFPREASQYFGDILSQFVGSLASRNNMEELPAHLQRACIVHKGVLTSPYEYIPRMRKSYDDSLQDSLLSRKKQFNTLVSLSGHLFDKFLINEALNVIEAAGGSFHLVKCDAGQNRDSISYSELEIEAEDSTTLDQIIDSLASIAYCNSGHEETKEEKNMTLKVHNIGKKTMDGANELKKKPTVLIIGAGRVCRPAAELLALGASESSISMPNCQGSDSENHKGIQVIVASLFLKDAEETIQGIQNAVALQLDVTDRENLSKQISEVELVISLLPAHIHVKVADVCIQHKKHLVTASYVDASLAKLNEEAQHAGVTILCEMGLDPGIDHMLASKMIHQAQARKGKIKAFTSFCGGLPSPAAANNPLAYKFSWSPAGAIRAGQNSAMYKSLGNTVCVDGSKLYDSAKRFRLPDFPAFALEYLPNRNSLTYGEMYGIAEEASTIFRGTLRYEGFSEIMATLAKVGLFSHEVLPILKDHPRPTYNQFLNELLKIRCGDLIEAAHFDGYVKGEEEFAQRILAIGHCKDSTTASKTAKTIKFLGFLDDKKIHASGSTAFDVTCACMEEKLSYLSTEQDMVLLHHELEVEFPNEDHRVENHCATLLEFGKMDKGKMTTAMARTVGIPVANGALLLLQNKIKKTGIVRPIEPEVYVPALDLIEAYGIKVVEKVECT